jgi:DNA-binding MarR family transcriptional regulator
MTSSSAPAPYDRARVPSPTAATGGPVSNAMVRVTRLHILRARQLFKELGLHPGQELLMMHLWDTGPQRQSDLAAVFDTDSPSMTRTVQRMERAGFVRRRRDPCDGRATLVESTEAGLALRERVEQLWTELETGTTGDMPPEERRTLLRSLEHLERNLVAVQCTEARKPGYRP